MKISLSKIGKILNQVCDSTLVASNYAIDSRKIDTDGIFFALKGEKFDGHNFLQEVATKGAIAAVVDKSYSGPGFGLELFFVDDVTSSLQQIAKQMLNEKQMRVIGITGSVGKTTTKEMIVHLLSKKFRVHGTRGSQNTKVTLPITILSAQGNEEFLVLEMGMTHSGQIKTLVDIAPPEIVVLTEITYVHSENFETLDDIAESKSEIFHPNVKFSVIHKNSIGFDAVYQNCLSPNVVYPSSINVISPYKESHLTENFCAAYHVAKRVGMDDNQIRLAALSMVSKKAPHRFEILERDGITIVDDSYNANLVSTVAALENLPRPKDNGRVILIFGNITELGSMSTSIHQMVAAKAAEIVDICYTIGPESKQVVEVLKSKGKAAKYFFDFRTLKDALYETMVSGDVVLIKGSNSLKMWELLKDDRALT